MSPTARRRNQASSEREGWPWNRVPAHEVVGRNMQVLITAQTRQRPQKLEIGDVFAKRISLDRGLTRGMINGEALWHFVFQPEFRHVIQRSREFLTGLFEAAVAAVHPSACLPQFLPPLPTGRLVVCAAGKAAG